MEDCSSFHIVTGPNMSGAPAAAGRPAGGSYGIYILISWQSLASTIVPCRQWSMPSFANC
jgi:hypothetical protein